MSGTHVEKHWIVPLRIDDKKHLITLNVIYSLNVPGSIDGRRRSPSTSDRPSRTSIPVMFL